MIDFEIKLAQSQKEIESAQRLRFEVFNIELGRGLKSSYYSGLDCDEYDKFCDHILIIDKKKKLTIGTYRILLRSRLVEGMSFYSENEFDITNIKNLKGEILEMGRSCVHKDYRSSSIIHLLWSGIMEYVSKHDVRYLTGCASIYTQDVFEVSKIYTLVKNKYFAPEQYRVYPKKEKFIIHLTDRAEILGEERKILLKLPSLVRSYLKIGALICGEPALDAEFGSVDFFMMLNMQNISKDYFERFDIKGK